MKKTILIVVLIFMSIVFLFSNTGCSSLVVYAANSESTTDTSTDTSTETSTYDETYTYTASLSEEYDVTFLNGIDSVESVTINYYGYYHYHYPTARNLNSLYILTGSTSSTTSYYSDCDIICMKLNVYNYIDYDVNYTSSSPCNTYSLLLVGNFTKQSYAKSNGYYQWIYSGTVTDIYITDLFFSRNPTYYDYVNISYYASPRTLTLTDENLDEFLDLDSTTNYEFLNEYFMDTSRISYTITSGTTFIISSSNIFDTCESNVYFHTGNMSSATSSIQYWFHKYGYSLSENNATTSSYSTSPYSVSGSTFYPGFQISWSDTGDVEYEAEFKYVITDIEFTLNHSYSTLECSIVLYNYDYNASISSVNYASYALTKDNCLYVAEYSGTLTNTKYLGIICSDMQNRIYDKYIYFYLSYDTLCIDASSGSFSLGFDFNVSKYYEPFVISSSDLDSYNLPTLTKPDGNILTNFSGWLYYGFMLLMFYNPIVQPISKFFAPVVGPLISLLNFFFALNLGTFVLSFLGFIIILNFVKTHSPINTMISANLAVGRTGKKAVVKVAKKLYGNGPNEEINNNSTNSQTKSNKKRSKNSNS